MLAQKAQGPSLMGFLLMVLLMGQQQWAALIREPQEFGREGDFRPCHPEVEDRLTSPVSIMAPSVGHLK